MPFSVPMDRVLRFAEEFPIGVAVAMDADASTVRLNRAARDRYPENGSVGTLSLEVAMRENRVVGPIVYAPDGADSAARTMRLVAAPLHHEDGTVSGGVALLLDADGTSLGNDVDEFRVLAASLPQIVWVTDPAGIPLYFNRRWFEYSGIDPVDAFGASGWSRIVDPVDRDRAGADFAATLAGGGDLYEEEVRLVRSDGDARWHLARALPVRDRDGTIVKWFGTFTDVQERKVTEAALRARAREERDVTDALPLIVWTAAPTGEVEAYNRRWYEFTGLPFEDVPGFGWGGVVHPDDFAPTVLAYARGLDSGHQFTIESRIRRADGAYRWHRSVAEPVRDEYGALYRWVGSTQDIESQKRAQAAQAALLARAEHTAAQLRFLAEIGRGLSRSLDFDETVNAVVEHVVPEYADWAVLRLVDGDGRLQTIATAHRDRGALPALDAFSRRSSAGSFGSQAASVMKSQTVDVLERVDRVVADDVDATIAPCSSATIPISFGTTVNGALHLAYTTPNRRYVRDDVALLEEIGRRSAAAIANAVRFGREHRVADRLQRALLPSVLPRIEGIRLDAFYAAGRAESHIGGDWYDAFRVAETRLVLTIGDVSGSGLEAAVTMASVRQSLRSLSQVDPSPAAMLDLADRALRNEDPNALVTAFVLVYDLATRRLTYASAGHPPPFVRDPDGSVRALHEPDLPLGLREGIGPGSRATTLEPGSAVVLYTDGVTEAQRNAIDGERRLIAALRDAPTSADVALAKHLFTMLVPGGSRDDVAILTMRCS